MNVHLPKVLEYNITIIKQIGTRSSILDKDIPSVIEQSDCNICLLLIVTLDNTTITQAIYNR